MADGQTACFYWMCKLDTHFIFNIGRHTFDPCTLFDLIHLFFWNARPRLPNAQKIAMNFDNFTAFRFDLPVYDALDQWINELEWKRWERVSAVEMEKNRIAIKQIRHDCAANAQHSFLLFFGSFKIFIVSAFLRRKKQSVEYGFIAVVRKWKSAFFLYALVVAVLVSFWLHFTFCTFENSSGFVERCSLLLCNICVVMF